MLKFFLSSTVIKDLLSWVTRQRLALYTLKPFNCLRFDMPISLKTPYLSHANYVLLSDVLAIEITLLEKILPN